VKQEKRARLEKKGFLVLGKDDEEKEIQFEIDYLGSLSLRERFALMLNKARELRVNLEKNGHRTASAIIKRK
jgi:hypothetical protein